MKLLLATYNLPPEAYGGTEVYLESLLAAFGQRHSVELLAGSTASGSTSTSSRFHIKQGSCWGWPAWYFNVDNITMPELYTTRATGLREFWTAWLKQRQPDLLHIHGHSMTVSLSFMEAAAALRIPVVFTLHNAILLCRKGDFVTWTGEMCDGIATPAKCMHCVTASRAGAGAGGAVSWMAGAAMTAAAPLLERLTVPESTGWPSWQSALYFPALMRIYFESRLAITQIPHRWHVFSEWSRHTLMVNGVPQDRIVLLRHAVPSLAPVERTASDGTLRLGFFGRFNKTKGVSVLLEAIRRRPDLKLRVDLYGRAQSPVEQSIEEEVRAASAADSRIVWHGQIAKSEQAAALAQLDVVVVPSMWIETGPLTVLEAFAAKLPVLGSDLSGINEWVRPGENGWLFPHGDVAALAEQIGRLCSDRSLGKASLVEKACRFPKLDSMAEHAAAVEKIYDDALAAAGAASPARDEYPQETRA